jgi:hypothetical protein
MKRRVVAMKSEPDWADVDWEDPSALRVALRHAARALQGAPAPLPKSMRRKELEDWLQRYSEWHATSARVTADLAEAVLAEGEPQN